MEQVRVWDAFVRIAHWTLALSVVVSYITRDGYGRIHDWAGYVALIVVCLRLIWGFVGSRHARFSDFIFSPVQTWRYARDVASWKEAHYLGHNPLGGWMAVALWSTVFGAGFTGWLYTTDRFWGEEWLETIHVIFGQMILPLAALHVAGVIFTSLRQKENLAAAMVHGWKRKSGK